MYVGGVLALLLLVGCSSPEANDREDGGAPMAKDGDGTVRRDTALQTPRDVRSTADDVQHPDLRSRDAAPTCGDAGCPRNMRCVAETEACECFGTVCPRGTTCNRDEKRCEPTVEGCTAGGSTWESGESAFRDASAEWNLPDIDARGVRITATDFNGDGWADLTIRRVSNRPNDFSDSGRRTVWLLRNNRGEGFEDVTRQSGLLTRRSGGDGSKGRPVQLVVWGDVDNDGDLDAYTGFDRPKGERDETAEIMLNQGDGTFELGPKESDLRRPDTPDVPSGASFVDYNRDGHLDLWVSQFGRRGRVAMQDQLYRGRGDGSFERVTGEMDLKTARWRGALGIQRAKLNQARAHSRAWSANACDLNDDGAPELLAASYGRAPNHLWKHVETSIYTKYENISLRSGYAFDDRTDWHDNASARCYCKLHPDAEDCRGVPDPTRIPCENEEDVVRWNHAIDREPFRLGGNSGTTLCADLDTDGQLDLLTNEIVHWDVGASSDPSEILYNRGGDAIRFVRPGNETTGLTRPHRLEHWNEGHITSAVFDFDNDARPDVYIGSTDYPGTRAHLWHQQSDGTFEHLKPSSGIDHTSSHGVGVADFDHDGDLDVVLGHSRNRCGTGDHCYAKENAHVRLFENTVGQESNWLQLDLVGGAGTNRAAIGARVEVETRRGTQVQEVDGGHGHYGIQHDTVLHFGLGPACRAEVTVQWPNDNRTTRTFELETGTRYRLEQGESPTRIDLTERESSP